MDALHPELWHKIAEAPSEQELAYVAILLALTCKNAQIMFASHCMQCPDWDWWYGGHRDIAKWPFKKCGGAFASLGAHRFLHKGNIAALAPKIGTSFAHTASALIGGHMELVDAHLEDTQREQSRWRGVSDLAHVAASGGHLSVLERIKGLGIDLAPITGLLDDAARKPGRLPLLKWLYINGARFGTSTWGAAISAGDMAVLEWLYALQCPWNKWTFYRAVRAGTPATREWLFGKGCPLTDKAFIAAAECGKTEIMDWLLERKCSMDAERTWISAATFGHVNALNWLREHRITQPTRDALSWAIVISGKPDALEWLRYH